MVLVSAWSCAIITSWRTYPSSPQVPIVPVYSYSLLLPPLSGNQRLICILSLNLPFLEFHMNGIIQYVVFCFSFFLLNITLLQFVHVVSYIVTCSFSLWNSIPLHEYAIFCLSTHQLMDMFHYHE